MNEKTGQPTDPPPLKLAALDADDLGVISAHLQDATVRVGDMAYLPKGLRFALVASRFDWPLALRGTRERCHVGLHFERVLKVARSGFDQDPDRVLNLLAIMFKEGQAPSGTIILTFSGGAAIRLEVECVEAALSDIGPRWPVEDKPGHASLETEHA